ncbi:hypothetical protein GUITHDRAFT_93550 [Guillardia theta CCMP2712]|uniref:Cilia- and flagella-associated protein 418 n=1 Tax=Guillardia theta (strain CCMP2712) TaxID=905079 RepID=L1JKF8_GUITC|nr:hypothetical protein GUITHDRAFT_93550 [Guillardia theta CCMP2712]EKX48782.1 hypothetical protein GUITHDRAFT_93550 [Guillardia theta CCMP2712]|eukprot:XP_005835762.1 hypothetical protein GUITHDRAFT_93550 [Guillardia theta CCMP2712]
MADLDSLLRDLEIDVSSPPPSRAPPSQAKPVSSSYDPDPLSPDLSSGRSFLSDLSHSVSNGVQEPSSRSRNASASTSQPTKSGIDELLDDLERDLDLGGGSKAVAAEQQAATSTNSNESNQSDPSQTSAGGTRKCVAIYLGGSKDETGSSPGRACDRLRCTKCDFDVLRIKDMTWHSDCEYLFFRNFYPDVDKLKQKLKARSGFCAYACQCTWRSASELTLLERNADMRWVCRGHSN